MWLAVAGWAAAGREIWGRSWLFTPEGVLTPEEARALASRPTGSANAPSFWRRFVPRVLARFARDMPHGAWERANLAFVWQRHDLFQRAGHDLARRLGVPLVLCVDAPVVWEARRWGVRRPGWGRLLERVGEDPLLRAADLVACISEEVAEEVARRGVSSERILVTPNGVDIHLFNPDVSGSAVRKRYSLGDAFVLGWIGSFHKFHGLDLAIEVAAELREELPELRLLLVGDGLDRARIEAQVRRLNLRNVVFTGTVDHSDIPSHIAAMDVPLVLCPADDAFHYSPLKLREYMACGRPVIAPRIGELRDFISDGEDGLLVEPGDVLSLVAAIRRLCDNPDLRASMGVAARSKMVRDGSWERQVQRTSEALRLIGTERC